MESLDGSTKNSSSKNGFFTHVFNFDDESKEEMLNIVQYSLLALLPIVILNKAMQKLVPDADDEKGNVEILAEVIVQVIVIFIGLLIIHRIITYVPTYSGAKYADFSVTNIILAVLIIILSLQTKLGEKVSILVDRVMELWEGTTNQDQKKNKGKGKVKVSQPISQNQMAIQQSLNSQSTSLSQLPPPQLVSNQPPTDYNNMYQQDNTPLVGAATPSSSYEGFSPMAANEALGGGFGGANW
jgi:hypothetical protein